MKKILVGYFETLKFTIFSINPGNKVLLYISIISVFLALVLLIVDLKNSAWVVVCIGILALYVDLLVPAWKQ